MLPIQIMLIAIFAVAMIKVIMKNFRGELSLGATILWVIFWALAAAITAQPDLTSSVAKIFGVGRGADIVVYFSLVGIFFMIFRLTVKIEKLNREITKVVRDKALK